MIYTRSIDISAPIERVFAFHEDPDNLLKISPPGIRIELLAVRGPEHLGRQVLLRMTQFGIVRNTILIEFVEYIRPFRLVDEQRRGPFAYWRQERTFAATGGGTRLTDSVTFRVPFGLLGRIAERLVVAPRVRRMFDYRQERTRELIEGEEYRRSMV